MPLGVDVGRRRIKAVQLARSVAGWRVEAAAVVHRLRPDLPLDREEARRLRAALREAGLHGRRIILAAPGDKVHTGIIELPPRRSGAPLEQLARAEFARIHKWQAQSFEMTCWDLPAPARATNSTFVMAAACTHDDANELLDVFEHEGFDVRGLDAPVSAVARACRPLLQDAEGIAAILDLGWSSSRLVMLYRGVVAYDRALPRSGVAGLVKQIAEPSALDAGAVESALVRADPDGAWAADEAGGPLPAGARGALESYFEHLVAEMRIPVSYLVNQYPDAEMGRLLLVGGGSELPGLKALLASKLPFKVRTVRAADLGDCSPAIDAECGPSLAAAIGLAQHGGR